MTWTSLGVFYSQGTSTVLSLANFQLWEQEILKGRCFSNDQQFDLDLWPCDLKINKDHLLSRGIHCTKFGNFQVILSGDFLYKDQEFDLDLVTWKSFGVFYSLRAFTVQSLATLKHMGPKIFSGHHLVYWPTDRLDSFFQRGAWKKLLGFEPVWHVKDPGQSY